ncbi:MAG: helix-turn-helix domain-containing protein [bacterium]|nr:helix-turn-helix domain-containing protein [bacterium]
MKCQICKLEMESSLESYHYVESGLENVQLDGIDVFRCSCGEEIISVPAMPELHSLIAFELIKKKSLLNGREIRFLRKNMGITGIVLAKYIGVDNATLSRWENNVQTIDKSHDRLLRLIYSNIKEIASDSIKHLIQEDFISIKPEKTEMPVFTIPREYWSKSNKNCPIP